MAVAYQEESVECKHSYRFVGCLHGHVKDPDVGCVDPLDLPTREARTDVLARDAGSIGAIAARDMGVAGLWLGAGEARCFLILVLDWILNYGCLVLRLSSSGDVPDTRL